MTSIFEGPPSKTRPKLQSKQGAPFGFQVVSTHDRYLEDHPMFTLSPIIMVQWKMAMFKKVTTVGGTHFLLNHDYGRKGSK